jgi:hypothetical protein
MFYSIALRLLRPSSPRPRGRALVAAWLERFLYAVQDPGSEVVDCQGLSNFGIGYDKPDFLVVDHTGTRVEGACEEGLPKRAARFRRPHHQPWWFW